MPRFPLRQLMKMIWELSLVNNCLKMQYSINLSTAHVFYIFNLCDIKLSLIMDGMSYSNWQDFSFSVVYVK